MSFCCAVCCYKSMNNAVVSLRRDYDIASHSLPSHFLSWLRCEKARKSQFQMPIYRPANRTLMSANLYCCRCYRENHIRQKIPLMPLHYIPFDLIYIRPQRSTTDRNATYTHTCTHFDPINKTLPSDFDALGLSSPTRSANTNRVAPTNANYSLIRAFQVLATTPCVYLDSIHY